MAMLTEHRFQTNLAELPDSLEIVVFTGRANWASCNLELKKEFTSPNFEYFSKNGEPYVYYNPLHIDLKIVPQRIPQLAGDDNNLGKFSLKIQVPLIGHKWHEVKQYSRLCEEIISIIPPSRSIHAYWCMGGKTVSIFKRFNGHCLRLKRKKYLSLA